MFVFSMKTSLLFYIAVIIFMGTNLLAGTGCANIIPPQGGPKDTLPPRLVSADPRDSATNFRGNRIVLNFDEFVDLQNVPQNLLFTPTFATNPQVDVRLRTITIRLRDSLEANTTYSFNFGNAIKDINEGNVLSGFTYTFSTGPSFDTLSLSGNVVLAESGRVDTTMIVILHRNLNDSSVVKDRPRYITKLDANGNFTFRNLPAGTFAVYALGDAVGRRYTSRTTLFAFADTPIVTKAGLAPLTLYAYREQPAATPSGRPTIASTNNTDRRLRYTTNLANSQQDLQKDLEMTFDVPLRLYDSNRLKLYRDSTYIPVVHTTSLDTTRRILYLRTDWQEGKPYHLIMDRDFAEDTLGRRLLKTDTLSFTVRPRSSYGSMNLRLRNMDPTRNPVLQLTQNGNIVYSAPVRNDRVALSLMNTGEYEMQLLYDRNGNGKWDPGQFFGTKRQPELVRPLERRVIIKGGQAADIEVSL
jgi:hypothetical protein